MTIKQQISRINRARTSMGKATQEYDGAEQLTYAGLMTSVELKDYTYANWAAVDKLVKIAR